LTPPSSGALPSSIGSVSVSSLSVPNGALPGSVGSSTPVKPGGSSVGAGDIEVLDFWGPNGEICGTVYAKGESDGCTKARNLQQEADRLENQIKNTTDAQSKAALEFELVKARAGRIDLYFPNEPSALQAVIDLSKTPAYINMDPAKKSGLWNSFSVSMAQGKLSGTGIRAVANLYSALSINCKSGGNCDIKNLNSPNVRDALAELCLWVDPKTGKLEWSNGYGGAIILIPIIVVAAVGIGLIWYLGEMRQGRGLGDLIFKSQQEEDARLAAMAAQGSKAATGSPNPEDPCKPKDPGEGQIRVGRWMSRAEFEAMQKTGKIQEGGGGITRVTSPPNRTSYTPPAGDIYAEFTVPSSSLKPHTIGRGWWQIQGPNSPAGRLANKKGTEPPQLPDISDLVECP
jgi:hypothetical protein